MDVRAAAFVFPGLVVAAPGIAAPTLAVPTPDPATSFIIEPDRQPIGVPVVVPGDEFATRRAR